MFGIEDFSKPIIDFANFDISQLGNALLFGLSMLAIGMITVFAVLGLLTRKHCRFKNIQLGIFIK